MHDFSQHHVAYHCNFRTRSDATLALLLRAHLLRAGADGAGAPGGGQASERAAEGARGRRPSRAWKLERGGVAWRAEFLRLRMRALRSEHGRLDRGGAAMQVAPPAPAELPLPPLRSCCLSGMRRGQHRHM